MKLYRIFDLQNEKDTWLSSIEEIKIFLGRMWEDDDSEMFDYINSESITIEQLQEVAQGVDYFIEIHEKIVGDYSNSWILGETIYNGEVHAVWENPKGTFIVKNNKIEYIDINEFKVLLY